MTTTLLDAACVVARAKCDEILALHRKAMTTRHPEPAGLDEVQACEDARALAIDLSARGDWAQPGSAGLVVQYRIHLLAGGPWVFVTGEIGLDYNYEIEDARIEFGETTDSMVPLIGWDDKDAVGAALRWFAGLFEFDKER